MYVLDPLQNGTLGGCLQQSSRKIWKFMMVISNLRIAWFNDWSEITMISDVITQLCDGNVSLLAQVMRYPKSVGKYVRVLSAWNLQLLIGLISPS